MSTRHVCALALSICACVLLSNALHGQGPVTYVYDNLGRLVGVVDGSGESAVYAYDAVGNLLSIERRPASTVSIMQFTPGGGPTSTSITIYGTGFSATPSQNTVTFNGTAATVTSSTTTQLITTVPTGATSGTIAVTTPLGSATSSTSFTVGGLGAPTISGFTPQVGLAGTSVTVSGTNFQSLAANNRTRFNVRFSTVSSSTPLSVVTKVPSLTTSGRITVSTPAGVATSVDDFFIPPAPYVASDVVVTSRVPFTNPFNVAIGTASKIGLLLFDGTAGQRVSLKVAPGPNSGITLYRPNQTVHHTHSTGILVTLMEPPLLPVTGTYQFMVDPVGSGTGTSTVTLYDVPADFSATMTPAQAGAQVTVTTSVPGQNGRVTWTGTVNDRVSVRISAGPLGTVTAQKPDGSSLGSGSIGAVASFIEPMTLPAAGTYALFADYGAVGTGNVTLTTYLVPPDVTGTITPGGVPANPVNVQITTPGQNGTLTFSGTSGQRVSMSVSGGTSGTVSLHRPDGSQQASVSPGIFAVFMEPQTLAETNTYSIRVNPSGTETGTITISLYNVPADTTGTVSIGGSAVSVPLGIPGQRGTLTFSGTASQQVTVRMTGSTFGGTTTVRLLRPDGTQLASTSSNFSNFNLATQTLPTTGTYTIVVDPSAANTGGVNVAVTNP